MKTESHTPKTDRAASESIAAVYETSKKLEKELTIVQNALQKEREWAARDRDKLRELLKQITQILK